MRVQFVTKKESDQADILEHFFRKEITQEQAALMLGISYRQIRRKLKIFLKEGIKGWFTKVKVDLVTVRLIRN